MKNINTKTGETPEIEINIIPLLKEILKKLWLIVLIGLVFGGAMFVGSKIIVKPTYRSGFSAYVNNKQGKENKDFLTSSDVSASKHLVLTYQSILTSNTILTAAAESMGIDMSYKVLRTKVTTEVQDETEIIMVYVVDADPEFAYEYAKAIAETAPKYMAQIVEGSSMKIIDHPEYSNSRYKPNYFKFAVIGFFIGALLVIIFVVIRYFLDDTVKNESDIETRFPIPILGVIPDITKASNKGSDYYYYEQGSKSKTETVNVTESEQKDEEK